MKIGSLFSGAGMLDEGVRAVLGGTVAWHAEVDPAACKVLDYRYPAVPNLGDVTAVEWAAVEPVDVVTAGYPCQPFSDAGQRKAEDDARYLWPQVARAISDLGPRLVVLENVRGHLVRGFARVVGELSDLGYDAQWTTVRASDIGAPHRRERLFCLAWPAADAGCGGRGGQPDAPRDGRDERRPEPAGIVGGPDAPVSGAVAADAYMRGCEIGAKLDSHPAPTAPNRNPPRRHADGYPRVTWGPYEPAIRRWERTLGRLAPAPTERAPKGGPRLSPRFVEFMMGWPEGWVTDVPGVSRNDALKICGNGVVPQQCAAALRLMLDAQDVAA